MRACRRPSAAAKLVLLALVLSPTLSHAWVSVSDADVDRPSGSTARSHVILEESAQIGYYARSSTLFPPKSLFVSGDMYVGRPGGSGTLFLAGAATISSTSSAPTQDITLNPGVNGKVAVLGAVQTSTLQAPSASELTLAAGNDITLQPGSGTVRVVAGQSVPATLQVAAIRSGDPASASTDLNLRSVGSGYIRLHAQASGGAVRIGGTRTIEAMPDASSPLNSKDLFISPAGDGKLVVGGTHPTVVVANVQSAAAGDVSLNLNAAGNGDVFLNPSQLGRVQIGGSRTIEAATQSGLSQDLILNPAGTGRVLINSQQSSLAPTLAAAASAITSSANVDLNVNAAGDGDVVVNAHGGAGRLLLGGSATITAASSANFPNQDLTLAPAGTGRLLVSGATPTIAAAGTASDQDLRINAGSATSGSTTTYGDVVLNGDIVGGRVLLGGARTIEGATDGPLTLRPSSGKLLVSAASSNGAYRAAVQPETAAASTADLVLAASGSGNVVLNEASSTSGSVFVGGTRTIEALPGGASQDLRLNPAGTGKLLVGGSSTIEVDAGSSSPDLTLNPRNSGQVIVGGPIKAATGDLRLEAASQGSISLLSRFQMKSAYASVHLPAAATGPAGYCLMGTGGSCPTAQQTRDDQLAVASANVVTFDVASASTTTTQPVYFHCDATTVGTTVYVWNTRAANTFSVTGPGVSGTPFTQNTLVICSCVPLASSTYGVSCKT
eukprot:tig00000984_g5986.t1